MDTTTREAEERDELKQERWELLEHINRLTDKPMIALSFVWLLLTIIDLTQGLGPLLQNINLGIWALFVLDFLIEIVIAPHKLQYLRRNWLTAISLLIPALRIFSIFRALRILRAARALRTMSFIRVISTINRSMRAIGKFMGKRGIGYVVALTVVIIFAGAAGIAYFENPANITASNIDSTANTGIRDYSEAVWWTAMLMTTMGTDYWPRTVEGRVLCFLLSLYAFAIFGYITATIATYFLGQDARMKQGNGPETDDRELTDQGVKALRDELAALRMQLTLLSEQTSRRQDST